MKVFRNLPTGTGIVNAPPDTTPAPTGLTCDMITSIRIEGMTCQHCVRAVFTALTPVEGIHSADVTVGHATVEHDGRVTMATLRDAIAVAGYRVDGGTEERRRLPLL